MPGSVVLLGGDPGIGKSTLLLQALANLSDRLRAVYVSGEESPGQLKLRAKRLGVDGKAVLVLPETCLENILSRLSESEASVAGVDSIQTVSSVDLESSAGSVGQLRECTARFVEFAKKSGCVVVLVGHVTKDGTLAGPRTLEHLVDTVLYFEGERGQPYRILRAVKNRYGSTNEVGVFEMTEKGLVGVSNASALFLAQRPVGVPGSVVVATVEGTRPILVEIQALVSASALGTPRRATLGLDPNRVAVLTALVEKKLGLQLAGHDIFVNVAGGVRIDEPASDLGVVAALVSSFLDRPVEASTVVLGEVGLAGEVRAIGDAEARIREAAALGFRRCVLPVASLEQLVRPPGIELRGVRTLQEAWECLF